MRDTTNIKYCRIQYFYKRLKALKLSHQFAVDIIKEFFMIDNEATVSRIISEDIKGYAEYEHADLDEAWIKGRFRKQYKEIIEEPIKEE